MLLGGLSLLGYNLWDNNRAQDESNNVLEELKNKKDEINNEQNDTQKNDDLSSIKIDKYNYIGIITIPKIDIELPVIDSFSNQKLKNAPCLYAGSVYGKNMIIAAHGYMSHFGKLNKLKHDDTIFFEDINGNIFEYSVFETDIIEENDVDKMFEGNWDLTLFTCTISGDKRVTIRAILKG